MLPKTRTPGWLDRPAEALNIILLAFVMMQAQRKVPLSFAFGERVRDDTKNRDAGLDGLPIVKGSSKNKNAGLVGPAASLSFICGERLVTSLSPRIFLIV